MVESHKSIGFWQEYKEDLISYEIMYGSQDDVYNDHNSEAEDSDDEESDEDTSSPVLEDANALAEKRLKDLQAATELWDQSLERQNEGMLKSRLAVTRLLEQMKQLKSLKSSKWSFANFGNIEMRSGSRQAFITIYISIQ